MSKKGKVSKQSLEARLDALECRIAILEAQKHKPSWPTRDWDPMDYPVRRMRV